MNENSSGICGTRMNVNGELIINNYGMIGSIALDPIEKKPIYHYMPGTKVLSFGLDGCNFQCSNCQNYELSQGIKHSAKTLNCKYISPSEIIDMALQSKADGIAYTYSEPTIFFEYALDVIAESRSNKFSENLAHIFVSNGYQSSEVTDMIIKDKLIDAINIDLKFIDEKKYNRVCGGRLEPVKENIKKFYKSGIHVEITNLIIPDENDQENDIENLCRFVVSIDVNMPVHFSRFFPRYKFSDKNITSVSTLLKAREIARKLGLRNVYLGNLNCSSASDTKCHNCGHILISRDVYDIKFTNVIKIEARLLCSNCLADNNLRLRCL
jgi:pyruvate formate lyase activating enzyme